MPHTMKKVLFLLMAAILMGSCALKNSANYTPRIYAGWPYVLTQDSARIDSLRLTVDTKSSQYLIDTLQVGDTMFLDLAMQTFANSLDSFVVTYDKATMECFYDEKSIKDLLPYLTDSVQVGANLHFQKGNNGLGIRLFSKMLKAGKHSVDLRVYSDAVFEKEPGMNTCSLKYDVLVVDTVQ